MKGIKIIRKSECVERIPTYDLTVKDSHHYLLSDGTISHNTQDLFSRQIGGGGTGPAYAASIILFLGKAKLKDGTEQTGIIVTAKPNKNRFAKPIPIKFHISFSKGMNPYIGLEEYISWDTCGIGRGKFITVGQFNKLTTGKDECRPITIDDKELYFQPSQTARKICVEHLKKSVDLKDLYTPEVITEDVLKRIEPIIIEKFKYNTSELTVENLNEILDDD